MKIIIAYASAGTGHFKAAEAIYNFFKQKDKSLQLKLIDTLHYSNFFFSNIYSYGYSFLVRFAPCLWSLAFYITYARPLRRLAKSINFIIDRFNTKGFAQVLMRENPDFVISTHFLPTEICAKLKRNRRINSKLITVITDFGVHPFWIDERVDIYVVASDFTQEKLTLGGIKRQQIKALGIPIDFKFLKQYEKDDICKKIGIAPDKFTVLVVTGSFGIGPIEEIVNLLYKDVQVLVVCAKNKWLFMKLKNKNYPQVKAFGFIDNIQELMTASDIIITKPGGLTISEILAMELVPVFISAIPGQEIENVRVLERYGVGLKVNKIKEIKDMVLNYRDNPDKLSQMRENIRRIKKPFAAEELYNVICQGSVGTAGGRAV